MVGISRGHQAIRALSFWVVFAVCMMHRALVTWGWWVRSRDCVRARDLPGTRGTNGHMYCTWYSKHLPAPPNVVLDWYSRLPHARREDALHRPPPVVYSWCFSWPSSWRIKQHKNKNNMKSKMRPHDAAVVAFGVLLIDTLALFCAHTNAKSALSRLLWGMCFWFSPLFYSSGCHFAW